MSEKKQHELKVPVYQLKGQAEYLNHLSEMWHVPLDILTGCIFADFIILVEEGLLFKEMTHHDLAVSYFKHAMKQKKLFDKLKQKLNEEANNAEK